jgi:uridine kinase
MTPEREAVLRTVAARIGPGMRVGVDGVTAAGKTTFADELAAVIEQPTVRVSIDDFHHPPEIRHARGEGPDTYYEDTFDTAAFRRAVAGTGRGVVLVADGIFIHKPELRDLWDLSIFLSGDRSALLERAIARDGRRERYVSRYVPGETRYLEEVGPAALADLVVDTTDPDRPQLVIDSGS